MGQKGFFDVERRLEAISAKGDPLETIKKIVPWEDFRADIEAVTETKPEERKSNAGRKPYDTILKFRIVVLQSLHNLSDEQTEYLIRDRRSFMRFLDLELEDPVPDATTIWLFREALAEAGLIDKLFERFGQHLEAEGYIARGGGAGAALVLPACNTEAMQLHLDEIATKVTPGAHAVLILDQAGWHGAKDLKAPKNISLLPLPPRAPELNPQENIWQFMRANWLSNRIFKSFDEIVDHCCYAWNTLIDQPWKIMSIARRDWAVAGQSL